MNRFAFSTARFAVKAFSDLSKAKVLIHGKNNIPQNASLLFVINHFTRFETIFLPYYLHNLTSKPVWSLADYTLFKGTFGIFLDKLGAVSTKNPDRDKLIVKKLLTGEASWVIFPEGIMVKNKKIMDDGRFMISDVDGMRPPHTGAATLALRTEFYRHRLRCMSKCNKKGLVNLLDSFELDAINNILDIETFIIPVNITYYPIRARENLLSNLVAQLKNDVPERLLEEIMTEGNMLLSGVDIDIRFAPPITIGKYLDKKAICKDIKSIKEFGFDDPIPSKPVMQIAVAEIMQNYMSEIYKMTTVNHDHLFASIINFHKSQKINEDDLKKRVFLAINSILDKQGLYLHSSFAQDQIALLTDDRYNQYGDFLSIACERKFVEKKGKYLIKKSCILCTIEDFHEVRIDNPVKVMLNEIEPLDSLQNITKKIAKKPSALLNKNIYNLLIEKAFLDYENDYKEFFIEGESKEKHVGMPYLLKGRNFKKIGIILIHGYLSAPLEVKELGKFLNKMGFWVYAPRLKGHGTSPEDLAQRTYKDWIQSVDEAYAILSSSCKKIIVGGFSFGAGLALDLAARVKKLAGVFAICPPMKLQDISSKFVPAVNIWNRIVKKVHLDAVSKEFVENEPENPHINYLRNPISGIRELEFLMDSLNPRLENITIPALIIQSYGDPVVNPKGSRKIFSLLGSKDKEYRLMNFDRHGIIIGKEAIKVHKAVGDFIATLGD